MALLVFQILQLNKIQYSHSMLSNKPIFLTPSPHIQKIHQMNYFNYSILFLLLKDDWTIDMMRKRDKNIAIKLMLAQSVFKI